MTRLGQNFLADPNLLDAIVRSAEVGEEDVVLEVGGGEGVMSERLAPLARRLWVLEIDEGLRERLETLAAEHPSMTLVFGDAMKADLAGLDPPPSAMVANLPYSIATPLLIRTVAELPSCRRWTVMVQREIADRLRGKPRTKAYGAPSVLVQLCCEVSMLRTVDPAVFRPRPRVGSALLRMERCAEWPGDEVARVVRGAFAHRRKALARSLANAGVAPREAVLDALSRIGLAPTVRAEELEPAAFVALAGALRA